MKRKRVTSIIWDAWLGVVIVILLVGSYYVGRSLRPAPEHICDGTHSTEAHFKKDPDGTWRQLEGRELEAAIAARKEKEKEGVH
jgi:hypothetical protein